jgi:hypothetical protein
MRVVALLVATTLCALAGPGVAHADDPEAAGEEFAAGEAADRRKDYRTAIAHYLRAYDLAPHPNALYNAAVDYERLGELREAATFYRRYLDEAPDSDDAARVERLIENLRKRRSKVAIRSTPPGAQIAIDGAAAGQAPVSRDLPGGAYTIAATLGERRASKRISVEYGEPADVVLEVTAATGTLAVNSNIAGAQVEIDGAYAGVTPLTVPVPAGDRKVIVRAEGYSTVERTVKVPGEGSAQITATMIRPLGYVAPVTPVERSYLITAGAGYALGADTPMAHFGHGLHVLSWEGALRVGLFGDKTYSYGILVRRLIGSARVKPFLGGWAEYGGSGSTSGDPTIVANLGVNGGLIVKIANTGRTEIDLVVDGGVALYAYTGEADNVLGFPITASVQFRPGKTQ